MPWNEPSFYARGTVIEPSGLGVASRVSAGANEGGIHGITQGAKISLEQIEREHIARIAFRRMNLVVNATLRESQEVVISDQGSGASGVRKAYL
jgi:hypothetical protein